MSSTARNRSRTARAKKAKRLARQYAASNPDWPASFVRQVGQAAAQPVPKGSKLHVWGLHGLAINDEE